MSMNFLNFAPFHQPYNLYSLDHLIGFAGTYPMHEHNTTKKLFPRVASRGLKWENKTYTLKRSTWL